MPSSPIDPSVLAVLDTVQADFPGTPFLALGQTALWDEPTKAVWRRLLDSYLPDARIVCGVHDTDYFAKTAAHLGQDQPYVLLPHDDGRTRDLWSAAGELSCLFGSESVPTRQMFLQHGVPFDWLARGDSEGRDDFFASTTTAWGWRGIVYTAANNVVAHDVPMQQIGKELLEQLNWGFHESLASLVDEGSRSAGERTAKTVVGWVQEFLETCSEDCRLSDLYQTLLPKFYELLLGDMPREIETTSSTALFQFNTKTAELPRFNLLNLFLDPKTRELARKAYDSAVGGSGSGIYTLAEFGDHAIPFDLVVPGIGRGTIHLGDGQITIQAAPNAIVIQNANITSVQELAAAISGAFGTECALVGKAITLVDMLACEFLVLFHETASSYTDVTRKFNQKLAATGMDLPLKPIVRLQHSTWSGLSAAPATTALKLPEHLAASFGQETISANDFAERWQQVADTQRRMLDQCRAPRKVRELLKFLEAHTQDGRCWCGLLDEYEACLASLREIAAQSCVLGQRIDEHRSEMQGWKQERAEVEARKGRDWRSSMHPLQRAIRTAEAHGTDGTRLQRDFDRQSAIRATAFDEPIHEIRERIAATRHLTSEFRRQRRILERGPIAQAARARLAEITREAQKARLELIRIAFLTCEGLEHTNLRPTAWWLPMVSPNGDWFGAMVTAAKARFEYLL